MVKEDSKKIVKYMLERAIASGDLNKSCKIDFGDLSKELCFEDKKYCRVCCQYLHQLQYINLSSDGRGSYFASLKAKGIDLLESSIISPDQS